MEIETTSMNIFMSSATQEKEQLGAEVISKTLDTLNQTREGQTNTEYEFQKDVLSAAVSGKGAVINLIV
jgi:hypothetical protein